MILAVVGSRTFSDYKLLDETLTRFHQVNPITEIVSGGARGADSLAERWANENNIPVKVYPAEWEKYGRRAGMIRNRYIISNSEYCFAFWDGFSHGTKNDIELCHKFNIPCTIVRF
jgi:hypothetical protein